VDNPDTLPIDVYCSDATDWWTNRLAETISGEGVSAILADFGEELSPKAHLADASTGLQRHNGFSRVVPGYHPRFPLTSRNIGADPGMAGLWVQPRQPGRVSPPIGASTSPL
jgi:hypothetical protein